MNDSDTLKTLERARRAARQLLGLSCEEINSVLTALADRLTDEKNIADILAANAADLSRMDPANPKYDRLKLTPDRLRGIAADTRKVATLPDPSQTLDTSTLPNGLKIRREAVPFGLIGVIYEARPNVTVDVFALCFKTRNACVLKGGHEAAESCAALVGVIHSVLSDFGINPDAATLLEPSREATDTMLHARGIVDLIIPRGSSNLINFVRANATVPVIETGAGVCHCYVDSTADPAMAAAIVNNAKTRRVSVCNALDSLLIDEAALSALPSICAPLAASNVAIHADAKAFEILQGSYPADLIIPITTDDLGHEYLGYEMSVVTIDGIDHALDHIARYGSGHSESIVTTDEEAGRRFQREVDAACVYVNAPTSFTDGAQFGLGAEIGISTQKLHARGPMALRELMTYKWLIDGNGQTRPA